VITNNEHMASNSVQTMFLQMGFRNLIEITDSFSQLLHWSSCLMSQKPQ